MPKVYVVQDNGRYNLTAAEEYGELVPLLPARLQLQKDSSEAVEVIQNKLIGYNNDDSILAIGDPAAIGIAMGIASFYNGGLIWLLKFDRQTNYYYRLAIDFSQFFEGVPYEV